jgi:hypothetical protein
MYPASYETSTNHREARFQPMLNDEGASLSFRPLTLVRDPR